MKRAVVTGSTKGIGKAIGIKLLENGYFVFFNYGHNEQSARDLEIELKNFSNNFKIIKNDFSSEKNIDEFCLNVSEKNIDVLVLNVGITDRTAWNEMTMEQWNHVLYTNLTAPAFLSQKLGGKMNNGGSILFIGSVLGEYPHSLSLPYGITKNAVHYLAKSLVKEYYEKNITVNAIATGFTDTQWQKSKPEEVRNRIMSKIAQKRFAEAEEIASLANEILNNKYINGSVVSINGGYDFL